MSAPDNPTSASWLVSRAWRENGLAGAAAIASGEAWEVSGDQIACGLLRLAPDMPPKDRTPFIKAFERAWAKMGGPVTRPDPYVLGQPLLTSDDCLMATWVSKIVARKTPVAKASSVRIKKDEPVDYPAEYEVMKSMPIRFGSYRYTGGRYSYDCPLVLTHRQLALHVEFAPLVAAVFLASRLPGSMINGMLLPTPGTRPRLSTLLEALVSRRPENMADEDFIPYVEWLLKPREPLWPDLDRHILG